MPEIRSGGNFKVDWVDDEWSSDHWNIIESDDKRYVIVILQGGSRPCTYAKHVYRKSRDEAEMEVSTRTADDVKVDFFFNEDCEPSIPDWRHPSPEDLYALALKKCEERMSDGN